MRRGQLRIGRLLTAGMAALLLAGCAAPVALPDPETDGPTRQACAALVAATPDQVIGTARRQTTGELAAAWGDPPITLACGIARPEGMGPTSQCLEVDGVGWWPQDGATGQVFTTLDRATYVQVGVPNGYGNTGEVLAQLSPVIAEHLPQTSACV